MFFSGWKETEEHPKVLFFGFACCFFVVVFFLFACFVCFVLFVFYFFSQVGNGKKTSQAAPKGCLLVVLKYLKASKRHPLEGPGKLFFLNVFFPENM